MNESYETTLLGVKNYSVAAQLPFHYILLDSWWYYRGDSGNVDIWDMRPTVFPRGLGHFASATGWSYQLHCGQQWSPQTHYSTRNGGAYNFVHDGSPTVVPDSQAFWDDLLANKTKDGMLTYEMDWMNDQMHQSKSMLTNATLGRTWLMQVDSGARKANATVQMCMTLVRQLLQSVEMRSVTNARASNDYHPSNDQWECIGTTSILTHALGIAPSKDSYWFTTAVQTGSHWGDNVREAHSELEAVVASLTTGPVATSDKIGHSNSSLILRSCDASGRLLTPDMPARELDAHFAAKAHLAFGKNDRSLESDACNIEDNTDFQGNDLGSAHRNVSSPGACCALCAATKGCRFFTYLNQPGYEHYCSLKTSDKHKVSAAGHVSGSPHATPEPEPAVGVDGHLQGTSVTLNGWKTSYVLAVKVASTYNLSMAELGYDASTKLVAVETHNPSSVRPVTAGLDIVPCGLSDLQLWSIAPLLGDSGWALLGEPDKWVSVSRQRFANLTANKDGASVTVTGAAGESVAVDWWSETKGQQRIHCKLGAAGTALVAVGGATGGACTPA